MQRRLSSTGKHIPGCPFALGDGEDVRKAPRTDAERAAFQRKHGLDQAQLKSGFGEDKIDKTKEKFKKGDYSYTVPYTCTIFQNLEQN